MAKPYLLLDVDGVLAVVDGSRRRGLRRHVVVDIIGGTHTIWLNPKHPAWLADLGRVFDVVWATGWEHEAPRLLSPLLAMPALPVIEFRLSPAFGLRIDKLPDVVDFVGDRATAWIDDQLGEEEFAWARGRRSPTLLIDPVPTEGMTEAHVSTLLEFAAGSE
jgi:hypothetical protein